eukprot:1232900-Rhodomonas_salina.2
MPEIDSTAKVLSRTTGRHIVAAHSRDPFWTWVNVCVTQQPALGHAVRARTPRLKPYCTLATRSRSVPHVSNPRLEVYLTLAASLELYPTSVPGSAYRTRREIGIRQCLTSPAACMGKRN